jgi:hypothetical protein
MEEITSRIWEHSEIEFIDLTSDEEINQKNSITDFCGIIAGLQDNINTEQRNLREIEIIDLCDEQLHHKNSLNNSCGVISQTSDDITTKVVTKSPMKKNYQKTSKDNCLIEKLSQIVNKLKVPIGGKISVCAGFELLMSALSAGSSNSPSVIQAKSSNENNLQLISSHVYPLKVYSLNAVLFYATLVRLFHHQEILHSSSFQLTEEKNLSLGYSEKDKSTQPHRCSTSACECSTCLDLKRTKKVKPSLTKLRSIGTFWLKTFVATPDSISFFLFFQSPVIDLVLNLLLRSVMLKLMKAAAHMRLIKLTVFIFGHLLAIQTLAIFPPNNFQEIQVQSQLRILL